MLDSSILGREVSAIYHGGAKIHDRHGAGIYCYKIEF